MDDTGTDMTDRTRLLGHTSSRTIGCDNSQDHGQDNHGYHSLDVPTDTGPQGESDSSKSHNHRWVIGLGSLSLQLPYRCWLKVCLIETIENQFRSLVTNISHSSHQSPTFIHKLPTGFPTAPTSTV